MNVEEGSKRQKRPKRGNSKSRMLEPIEMRRVKVFLTEYLAGVITETIKDRVVRRGQEMSRFSEHSLLICAQLSDVAHLQF